MAVGCVGVELGFGIGVLLDAGCGSHGHSAGLLHGVGLVLVLLAAHEEEDDACDEGDADDGSRDGAGDPRFAAGFGVFGLLGRAGGRGWRVVSRATGYLSRLLRGRKCCLIVESSTGI